LFFSSSSSRREEEEEEKECPTLPAKPDRAFPLTAKHYLSMPFHACRTKFYFLDFIQKLVYHLL
jgi:hypothetical protein